MKRYLIGNLIVDIEADCKRLARLGVPYESNVNGNADISFKLSNSAIEALMQQHPNLTRDEVAYIATGTLFYQKLTLFDGLMLHSSAIMMDGRGYMFSAASGTGKSTHASLWKKVFGDRVTIINDDKPIIRKIDGEYRIFGTPWSGKTDLNVNTSAPLKGIVFIERGNVNAITKLDTVKDKVATLFLEQTLRPKQPERALSMLTTADDILNCTNVFKLSCDISDKAVYTAYNALKE